jgi:hypothetical protein
MVTDSSFEIQYHRINPGWVICLFKIVLNFFIICFQFKKVVSTSADAVTLCALTDSHFVQAYGSVFNRITCAMAAGGNRLQIIETGG